jgi:hypothetical protein
MVSQGIETWARTSLVTIFEVGSLPLMLARDADALLLGIELNSSLLLLCKRAIGFSVTLLTLSSEGTCFRCSVPLDLSSIGLELLRAQLGEGESSGEYAGCCEPCGERDLHGEEDRKDGGEKMSVIVQAEF